MDARRKSTIPLDRVITPNEGAASVAANEGDQMKPGVAGSPVSDVVFEEKRILLVLEDGRSLAAPLGWVGPVVAEMNASERVLWVTTPDGRGVNWPAAGQTSDDGVLNVWTLEQDALFEEALAELSAAGWKPDSLSPRSRSLVALWRLIADGYNGGLLQFLGNWGVAEVHAAFEALTETSAAETAEVLHEFWRVVGPIAESDDVSTIDDVYRAISGELSAQLTTIDERFWDVAEELIKRVPLTYGPATSASAS